MDLSRGSVETLEEVPPHVWVGLPEYLRLGHSATNRNRIGVWATQLIPKGRRFGPFVGEKKERSQVTSKVYMWEVYCPSGGWMCVDATDPLKGNWLRYVNWARSREEQNVCALETNRAIYYKTLRPIGAGEELLLWYSVQEDKPEVTAAPEEARANCGQTPGAKRARRKLLERASPAGLGGFGETCTAELSATEMWDGDDGVTEEDQRPSIDIQQTNAVASMNHREVEKVMYDRGKGQDEEEEQMEEDGDELEEDVQQKDAPYSFVQGQPRQSVTSADTNKESHSFNTESTHSGHNAEIDPDYDPDLEGDPHGLYPCHQCERHFSTKQGLERHLHIHSASNQPPQMYSCRYCSKAFSSQVGRRRHERRHENGFKKNPGSLAGTAHLLSNVAQTNASSPVFTNVTSHYTAIGTQLTGAVMHNMDMQKKELIADRPFVMEENGESKELHPCKYCNKAFGTHTNMRRHQRRIHERHLLPKGVRRKGMLLQEAQQLPGESPSASPPPVYMPSADTEDETDRDDYAVDISKNISDNLNYYIDGKIVSTSAASSCDVIEVDSRSAALFGIISPSQLTQALKVEPRLSTTKQVANIGKGTGKRRTSTPPLVPNLKVETDTQSLTVCPPSSSSSSSMLVGGLFQQDPSSFQREKTVYLSPKLKQLLQTQDMQKATVALLTESHRLASVTPMQGTSGRFKRRTASPPASPQLSPPAKVEKSDGFNPYLLKVPKLESHSMSLLPCSMNDRKDEELPENTTQGHSSSNSGDNICNQQPLDLSNSFTRKSDNVMKVLGDGALDLSCKHSIEPELKGSPGPQPPVKKRKPNTSMLEKVLMNKYVGLPLPGDESPTAAPSCSPNVTPDSGNPSPPSLTPVTLNPSSPMCDILTSPTPPPPVLPTIPSPPPIMPSSPLSQPSESAELRPLPVLSLKMSPRSELSDAEVEAENEKSDEDTKRPDIENGRQEEAFTNSPSSLSLSVDHEPMRQDTSPVETSTGLLNGKMESNMETKVEKSPSCDDAAMSPKASTASSPVPPKSPSPNFTIPEHIQIKEEEQNGVDGSPISNHAPEVKVDPNADAAKTAEEENDLDYCKTFVCNVCDEPFDSIKELSGHITAHAEEWPFKCEFCVQLFTDGPGLLEHRSTLHGVGTIYVCSVCSKEFAFLCNLEQHQQDLHPNAPCTHTTVESGKLRPQNYTDPTRAKDESSPSTPAAELSEEVPTNTETEREEPDVNGNHTQEEAEDPNEELYTTIKIMASEGGKPKGPDVRLGINQHYPSFKPPPFPYHSRSHASVASATNFTTHNIPQTFSTAIRCTKCGNSFDNMPELHQHILACANASDKKRYTPKKNPIPLKQIVKSPNGVVSPTAAAARLGAFRRMGQPKRLNFNIETGKMKMSALSKKKNQLVQKAISQRNKSATNIKTSPVKAEEEQDSPSANLCPHCSREFSYTASLTKHSLSCPMRPVVKKGKKAAAAEMKKEPAPVIDKSMSLRKKGVDPEPAQTEAGAKPLGKTRARSSGAAEPEPTQPSKGKGGPGRPKKQVSLPEAKPPPSKKAKKGSPQSVPPAPPAPADPPADPPQKPAPKSQPKGKEATPKKPAETKSPPGKKERFSLRSRSGGPITRSAQATAASAPGQAEEQPSEETKDSQEAPVK
ncbi:PR domain zinc finger protein 2 [Eucyclogobius newberryi]|uniref:PR domain zinc finger protein 2 n=1 Tax=Eucyclogobius newberryi TaxID=166745 RepID=UPI003B5C7ECA